MTELHVERVENLAAVRLFLAEKAPQSGETPEINCQRMQLLPTRTALGYDPSRSVRPLAFTNFLDEHAPVDAL